METLGKISFYWITMILGSIINAFVVMKLWAWIITPLFMVQELPIAHAFGIWVLVAFLKIQAPSEKEKEENSTQILSKSIVWIFVKAGWFLLIGWVASMFI